MSAKHKYTGILAGAPAAYSDPIDVHEGLNIHFSVSGTFSATAVLQIRFKDVSTDWRTWVSTTTALEQVVYVGVDCEIRVGCPAWASGAPLVEARVSRMRD